MPDDYNPVRQWDLDHIKVATAWAAGFTGDPSIIVCLPDTGIDYTHPDLAANVWVNPIEKAGSGATAGNGYKNNMDDDNNSRPLSEPAPGNPSHTCHECAACPFSIISSCVCVQCDYHLPSWSLVGSILACSLLGIAAAAALKRLASSIAFCLNHDQCHTYALL